MGSRTLLAVAIPTYQRPDRLQEALGSVLAQLPTPGVEVLVSDNSTDTRSQEVTSALAERHGVPVGYTRHVPGVGMYGNFNACVELSSAEHVLILHDDDQLLPGAVEAILASIARAPWHDVRLFGVQVVTPEGDVLRRQRARRREELPPHRALQRLMTRSSFVRFPAIVVSRRAYLEAGLYDDSFGGASDVEMFSRLFARYGVVREPPVTAAYLVHEEAATTRVFTPTTIEHVARAFANAGELAGIPPEDVARWSAHWYHQFILAGAVRALRARDRRKAGGVLQLLGSPGVAAAGRSARWLPLRVALAAATIGTGGGRGRADPSRR